MKEEKKQISDLEKKGRVTLPPPPRIIPNSGRLTSPPPPVPKPEKK